MRTTYEKIFRAAYRGTGTRLSSDEVAELARDDALFQLWEQDRESAKRCTGIWHLTRYNDGCPTCPDCGGKGYE